MKILCAFLFLISLASIAAAQTETLTNAEIVEMTRAGLGKQIILQKIDNSAGKYDLSAKALVELKKAGVEDEVIEVLLKSKSADRALINDAAPSPTAPKNLPAPNEAKISTPAESVRTAKTIALVKSSLQPSRQALEKELMRRNDWQKLNLTLTRYKDTADLYVEIGYVPLSWITHRYVFRVYDRRSGAVIAAGETTSWGSLATNLARNIAVSLSKIAEK